MKSDLLARLNAARAARRAAIRVTDLVTGSDALVLYGEEADHPLAEALGGVRRPWRVDDESGRIPLTAQRELAA